MKTLYLLIFILMSDPILSPFGLQKEMDGQHIYITQNGSVRFISDAPLELIDASSQKLSGALDLDKRVFAFKIPMNSFVGFNDPLQKEHFCEKFLECEYFPTATFQGRLIEDYSFSKSGIYEVRAKGIFNIHGVKKERLIPIQIESSKDLLRATANFTILLADHDIKIPQVVFQKIAEEIRVTIEANLYDRNSPQP